jgi:hypothetical protein
LFVLKFWSSASPQIDITRYKLDFWNYYHDSQASELFEVL